MTVLTILYLFGIPLAIMLMAKRWPIIQKISPMVILYVIGLAAGNTFLSGDTVTQLCTNISNVVVLMSIPLMLMGCNFKMWSTKAVAKTFLVGVFSVLCVTLIGFFLFRTMAFNAQVSNTNYAKISAVMTGIYIGGIPNLAPISKAVGLPQHLFLMVSGYDLIVTGLYLILIVFFGEPIIRRIFKINHIKTEEETELAEEETSVKNKKLRHLILNRALGILTAFLVVAISYALSLIIPLQNSTAVIIIVLTTVSLLLSLTKPVKHLEGTFDLGLYFVYVFCLAVATLVNIHDMEFSKHLFILYYIAFVIFGSLALQIILAKIFRINGDLVLVSSIALINSPPFVPMVAAILNNKDIILPGIAIGLLGYAVGNYLGIGIFTLLS
jgi:Predicted integral membrane protein